MHTIKYIALSGLLLIGTLLHAQKLLHTQVLVVGGGTGGTAAGIQAARIGVPTMIVESGPWLGGMLSSAGVSATDGNHILSSGIWQEFREQLYKVYGGPDAVATGWVSNTQFEPHVADSIFKSIARHTKNLEVLYGWQLDTVFKKGNTITGARFVNAQKQTLSVDAAITIDATELGDVMAKAKVPYDLGMESSSVTGENLHVPETNSIIQDLTYVAVLKDYGPSKDCTIIRPEGYDPAEFDGSCTDYYYNKNLPAPTVDSRKMLDYGKLPHNKYMLNWPKAGNDCYLNVVEMSPAERAKQLEKAKAVTLRFVYFIQHDLGYKNLGLADNEFPTADRLALMPYYRESRRLKGMVRFTIRNISEPFTYGDPLYRTGISVGDYPVDHHHGKNPAAPQHLGFYPVPSFNVPLGTLIPSEANGLVVADKGISVSNIVNGTTRLQPCVLLTGQAAGVLAALSARNKKQPRQIAVRAVQATLLNAGAWIMPYADVLPMDKAFKAIQKIGATGILKGTGVPQNWANKTYFYPDKSISEEELVKGLSIYYPSCLSVSASGREVTLSFVEKIFRAIQGGVDYNIIARDQKALGFTVPVSRNLVLNRKMAAVIIDHYLDPFSVPVRLNGHLSNEKH